MKTCLLLLLLPLGCGLEPGPAGPAPVSAGPAAAGSHYYYCRYNVLCKGQPSTLSGVTVCTNSDAAAADAAYNYCRGGTGCSCGAPYCTATADKC